MPDDRRRRRRRDYYVSLTFLHCRELASCPPRSVSVLYQPVNFCSLSSRQGRCCCVVHARNDLHLHEYEKTLIISYNMLAQAWAVVGDTGGPESDSGGRWSGNVGDPSRRRCSRGCHRVSPWILGAQKARRLVMNSRGARFLSAGLEGGRCGVEERIRRQCRGPS